MVLESTMICVDNSDYMRNQDFLPTRLHAQQDAVYLVCSSKIRSNPENSVGLLTLADVGVLVTLTSNVGRIITKLHQVQPYGNIDLHTGIKVANLALKHRQDKNHRKRIVAFIASPVTTEEVELVKLAKNLKKDKVNLDIVSFGEDNTEVFTCFINTLNGKDGSGSHFVEVAAGMHLSDILISSPIIQDEDGAGVTAIGFDMDVDPNDDPELALALRISLEEERRRQEEERRHHEEEANKTEERTSVKTNVKPTVKPTVDFANMTAEEQLAYAVQMSMPSGQQTPFGEEDYGEVMNDPAFLQSALENLPGVDPNSETIRQVVNDLKNKKGNEKNEKPNK